MKKTVLWIVITLLIVWKKPAAYAECTLWTDLPKIVFLQEQLSTRFTHFQIRDQKGQVYGTISHSPWTQKFFIYDSKNTLDSSALAKHIPDAYGFYQTQIQLYDHQNKKIGKIEYFPEEDLIFIDLTEHPLLPNFANSSDSSNQPYFAYRKDKNRTYFSQYNHEKQIQLKIERFYANWDSSGDIWKLIIPQESINASLIRSMIYLGAFTTRADYLKRKTQNYSQTLHQLRIPLFSMFFLGIRYQNEQKWFHENSGKTLKQYEIDYQYNQALQLLGLKKWTYNEEILKKKYASILEQTPHISLDQKNQLEQGFQFLLKNIDHYSYALQLLQLHPSKSSVPTQFTLRTLLRARFKLLEQPPHQNEPQVSENELNWAVSLLWQYGIDQTQEKTAFYQEFLNELLMLDSAYDPDQPHLSIERLKVRFEQDFWMQRQLQEAKEELESTVAQEKTDLNQNSMFKRPLSLLTRFWTRWIRRPSPSFQILYTPKPTIGLQDEPS